jgi:hypothetical protein
MKFFSRITFFILAPCLLNAVNNNPLNQIERSLVGKYIQLNGLSNFKKKVALQSSNPLLSVSPFEFKMTEYFFKSDCETNNLTKAIFDQIQSIEAKYGYNSKRKRTYDGHYCMETKPTNYLGHYTRYYWLEGKSSVYTVSKIKNRKVLNDIAIEEIGRLAAVINKEGLF